MLALRWKVLSLTKNVDNDVTYEENFTTFFTLTLVKRIGIAFFLHSLFFGVTNSFRIFGHAFVYNR